MREADLHAMTMEDLDGWIQRRGAEAREARQRLQLAKEDIALGHRVLNARMTKPARQATTT